MLISSVIGTGLGGVMGSIDRSNAASSRVSGAAIDGDAANLTQSMVDQKKSEWETKASANVIKTADRMIGTIIDIRV